MAKNSVCIVGKTGSGKTTLLGMLYIALTSYSGWKEPEFKFSTNYYSTQYFNQIERELREWHFPATTNPGSREQSGLLITLTGKRGTKNINLYSYDIVKEYIDNWMKEPGNNSKKNYSSIIAQQGQKSTFSAIFQSDILVFNLDSCVFNAEESDKIQYDHFLQETLTAIVEKRKSTNSNNIKKIGFIFSKYDESDPILPLGKVRYIRPSSNDNSTDINSDEPIMFNYFMDIFEDNLPHFFRAVDSIIDVSSIDGSRPENINYFRSGILTDKQSNQPKSIAKPITFSFQELIRFASWLYNIS